MVKVDYLVVGSGLTGAVIARTLYDQGKEVLVVDRRSHLGGNVHDHLHQSGIRVHTYGPHGFRTSSDRIWEFVNQFSKFIPFEHQIKTFVDKKFEDWPVTKEYLERTIGSDWKPYFKGQPKNFEEASLSKLPKPIYKKFIKAYTEKQWGVSAKSLSSKLATRFYINSEKDLRLTKHKYQGLPKDGYSDLMANMLSGIPLMLNTDYLQCKNDFKVKKCIIFTGPIDEFFSYCYGKLTYRSQKRENIYFEDKESYQPSWQVNYPSPRVKYIRSLEWKKLPNGVPGNLDIKGSLITRETPFTPENPDQYEYPFPDEKNKEMYLKYRELANSIPNLLICGRLGEYRYYDMDQAIGRAMQLADRLIEKPILKI